MDRILDDVAAIYYPIFFNTCLILQLLLTWLIATKTPKVLRKMRWFLYPSNAVNFILTCLAFFLQFRNANNQHSMALLCRGPCKYLGPQYCFHGYVLILAVATAGGVLNIHMMYYRMVTVKFFENFNYRVLLFCLWYTIPLLLMVLSYIPPTDFEFVRLETLKTHPDYDFEPYKEFGGFANSHHICMTLVTLILLVMATGAPMLGFYWRREALKIMDKNQKSLSDHSILQFKALIQGLTFQIMLPLICYCPVVFFYVFNKYSANQIIISQYTLGIMMTLPAALDPLLQISFIVPYRNAVKPMLLCRKPRIELIESNPQNTVTFWQRRKSSHPMTIAQNHTV